MPYSITIDLESTDFSDRSDFVFLEMKILFQKYNYTILTHSQRERLVYLAKEFSEMTGNVVAIKACYNYSEIMDLNAEMQKLGISLDCVYIPSQNRIEQQKSNALINTRYHGRWLGSTEDEVLQSYDTFSGILQEIKTKLLDTSIHVKEV